MSPFIGVIIPIYKVGKYLNRCIESIVNQTYKNIEIILVDDGSPDNSSMICDEWVKKDNRIIVVHKQNGGLSDARNAGMFVVESEYISFIDSDDWIDLRTFELTMSAMLANEAQIGAFNFIRVVDSKFEADLTDIIEVLDSQNAIENTIDDVGVRTVAWNKIYHRNTLAELSFLKGKLNEDEFFTFYALATADRIVYLHRQCYYYFQRETSIMGTYNIRRLDMLEGVKERMDFTEIHYPDIYIKAKISFCTCCLHHYQMILKNINCDKEGMGRKKIEKMRSEVKLKLKECKNVGLINMFSLILSNSRLGLKVTSWIRNVIGVGL